MSGWVSPEFTHLQEVVSSSEGRLLLCSPYISNPALNVVAESLPDAVSTVEVWTRLEPQDWLTGVSDPEGLLDFMGQVRDQVGDVPVRHAERLHAKIIVSDGPQAIAGSANLTRGGFARNIEAARIVTGDEIEQLRGIVDHVRPRLTGVTQQQFRDFVSQCAEKTDSQEALLDLIRQEMPAPDFGPAPLTAYGAFLDFLATHTSPVAGQALEIARNWDGNNNTGKVKQAFFGVQRFLQEYPHHRAFVEALPDDEWFDVADSLLMPDWRRFLADFAEEANPAYGYSIATLRGYLTVASGGTRTGGGGGDNQLKRVWPLAGRATAN